MIQQLHVQLCTALTLSSLLIGQGLDSIAHSNRAQWMDMDPHAIALIAATAIIGLTTIAMETCAYNMHREGQGKGELVKC
jgi:hypothetical protein